MHLCVCMCVCLFCVCVYFVCVFGEWGWGGCSKIFLFPLLHLSANLPKLIFKTILWLLCDQKQLEELCVQLFMRWTLVLTGLTLMFTWLTLAG